MQKQGYQWPHKRTCVPQKILKNNNKIKIEHSVNANRGNFSTVKVNLTSFYRFGQWRSADKTVTIVRHSPFYVHGCHGRGLRGGREKRILWNIWKNTR